MTFIRRFLGLALILFATGVAAQTSSARLALVVGNAAYEEINALDNPGNDAGLMGDVLSSAGFEVRYLFDASQAELNTAIVDFGRELRRRGPETVGLFYFAGHGVQSNGKNYLLPVDAQMTDAADLDLVAIEADVILRQMGSAKNRTNIVILDACRNNPFAALAGFEDDGLAEMKARPGTFLSYATGPGDVALDGLGRHSPFTEALAREMQIPGTPIEQVFKKVRISVVDETRGIQIPWDTSLLTTDFTFFEDADVAQENAEEAAYWAEVSGPAQPLDLIRFLRAHPRGLYASEARNLLQAALNENESAKTPKERAAKSPVIPSAEEFVLFETARLSGSLKDYETYLANHPDGAFADLVRLEIDARR